LLLYSSHLALGVSNWPVIYFINYTPTSSLALFITAPSVHPAEAACIAYLSNKIAHYRKKHFVHMGHFFSALDGRETSSAQLSTVALVVESHLKLISLLFSLKNLTLLSMLLGAKSIAPLRREGGGGQVPRGEIGLERSMWLKGPPHLIRMKSH
jgi:hypothetical protein